MRTLDDCSGCGCATDMDVRRLIDKPLACLVAITTIGAIVRAMGWPTAPESWDGVAFVEAVQHFDLAKFRPHPPGYPLFVALGKVSALVVGSPLHAVVAVSFVLGTLAPVGGFLLVRNALGERSSLGAIATSLFLAVAPGMVVSSTATIPDGAALSIAIFAYAIALRRPSSKRRADLDAALAGVLVGACIGVRPTSALLVAPVPFVAMRGRGLRGMAIATLSAVFACVAWAIPTARIVGTTRWWELSRAQLTGHLAHWGEAERAWSGENGTLRALGDAIALQLTGTEGRMASTIALVGVLAIVAFAVARRSLRPVLAIVVVMLPFALFVTLAQPMGAAPRHALPITTAVVVACGMLVDRLELRAPSLALALSFAIAWRGIASARTHRLPPAAVAMLRFVDADRSMSSPAVVSGRSSRFADHAGIDRSHVRVAPGALPGDAIVFAMRADPLPRPLLVTSELDLRNLSPSRLEFVATFHRDSPLDRRERTLVLYRLAILPVADAPQTVP